MKRQSQRSWSGILLAVSNFGNFAFPMLRGIVLARLLSPSDFGLAISITIVSSVVELITDVGLGQFALRVGDDAIPTLHSLAIIRSALLAFFIVACGPLFASTLNGSGTAWIYTLVGFSSFVRGFSHLGVKTAMRAYNFVPEAVTDLTTHFVWTVTSAITAYILRDYRSMVIGLLAYTLAYVFTTRFMSKQRWTLGWDRAVISESITFGKHLIPNGIALAVLNMGERAVIGSRLGLESLARYSALSTSAFTPRSVVVRFLTSLVTPQFVNASSQVAANRLLLIWTTILSAVGGVFAFGYMAFGQPLLALVFGHFYGVGQDIINLIAILSCIRFMASFTVAPSIARGNTQLVFVTTASASSGILLGLILITFDHTIKAMVIGMCIGEAIAAACTTYMLLRAYAGVRTPVWIIMLMTGGAVVLCGVISNSAFSDAISTRVLICGAFAFGQALLLLVGVAMLRVSARDVFSVFMPVRASLSG